MMQDNPLISIVIPMYNAQDYIEETVQSVISQSYQDWEMIIVNNASTDRSIELIEKIEDPRIRVITLSQNSGGPAKPRNEGVKDAKGEYIAFLDADDLWTPDKLQKQLDYMVSQKMNFSSTGKTNINEASEEINFKANILAKLNAKNSKKDICDLIKYRFIFTSTVMVKRTLDIHFNEENKYRAVEDLCAWLKLFNQEDTRYIFMEERLLKYRILAQSASNRNIEYINATKAYICILNFILKYEMYENMKCFYKACARDFSLNFLQKTIGKNK